MCAVVALTLRASHRYGGKCSEALLALRDEWQLELADAACVRVLTFYSAQAVSHPSILRQVSVNQSVLNLLLGTGGERVATS